MPSQAAPAPRLLPALPTSAMISIAATHDQHAFQHGGEIFRLVVAVLVIRVGRLVADPDRPERAAAATTLTIDSSASE
jgi:hypothetical protein